MFLLAAAAAVETRDFMSADWAFQLDFLQKLLVIAAAAAAIDTAIRVSDPKWGWRDHAKWRPL